MHNAHMEGATADQDWRRLAEYVTAQRDGLGMTQGEVYAAGGPSVATMRMIENALQTNYRGTILGRLERALRWKPGSVRAILAGGEPEDVAPPQQVDGAGGSPDDQLLRRLGDALADPEIPRYLRTKLAARLQETYDQWLELVRATAEAGRDPEPSGDEQPAPSRRT